jgi:hypothetical protein
LKRIHGNHCKKSERRAEAEVQLPQAQPVPTLRAAARVSAQVWRLPLVFPRTGAQGRDPRRRQVKLVATEVHSSQFEVHSETQKRQLVTEGLETKNYEL